jgi:hypothetical protein
MRIYACIAAALVLQAPGAAIADTTTIADLTDTYLVMNRDSTPDTQPLLIVEGYDCSACIDQRVLIKFDTKQFTTDATISKASLLLYSPEQPRPGAANVRVYRLTRSWDVADASWNTARKGIKWSTPGGDFEPTPLASLRYADKVNVWHTYDVTDIVKGFVAKPETNFGIMLMMDPVMKTVAYASAEAVKTEFRPKLAIEFTQGSSVSGLQSAPMHPASAFTIVGQQIRFAFPDVTMRQVWVGTLDGAVVSREIVYGRAPVLKLPGTAPGIYLIRAANGYNTFEGSFRMP